MGYKKPDKLTKGGKIIVAILVVFLIVVSYLVARSDDKKNHVHKFSTERLSR